MTPHQAIQSLAQRYPRWWAAEIVTKEVMSYARAWEILFTQTRLTHSDCVCLLAANSPDWHRLVAVAHQMERWLNKQARMGLAPPTTTQMLSVLSDSVLEKFSFPVKTLLMAIDSQMENVQI